MAQIISVKLGGLVGLLLLLPGITAAVRRMHDIGKSGWFLRIGLIPPVGLILIYRLVQPTQPEANQYGEPPTA